MIISKIAAALGATAIAAASFAKSEMVNICEQAIIDRIGTPGGFRLISATETTQPISFSEYFAGREYSPQVQEVLRKGPEPARLIALITFEALNAHGTPIRSAHVCTYNSLNRKAPDSKEMVEIDGKTKVDLLLDHVKRLAPSQPRSKR